MATVGTPRLLIVRLSHIGDAALTVPLAYAIRDHWKEAYVAWAAEPAVTRLLRGHPAVDHIIEVPTRWLKRVRAWSSLRRELRSHRFDIALDPQSLLKSSALAWLSGARMRIGFDGAHGREGSRWLNNTLVKPQRPHLVDRSLELLEPLGVHTHAKPRFEIPIREDAIQSMNPFLARLRGEPFVAINPGAGWDSRRWPIERFAQVARWLKSHCGWRSVITWGGESEQAMAHELQSLSCGAAVMAPPTTLNELMALLSNAQLYFGGDTGPMHLANAVGTRCVGLYGPTRPEHSGAYGAQHLAIVAPSDAPHGGTPSKHSRDSIDSIQV
ncbi:MAG TPA: glycosyltransferase family 9 protein, partial [Pirellulaceae bacterium]|nr:glycosyltransferase family 9 protein [Pirellulaceae bacterium]